MSDEHDLTDFFAGQLQTIESVREQRDGWIRLFNRLEAAISHHRRDTAFADEADERLWAARGRVLRDAAAVQEEERP